MPAKVEMRDIVDSIIGEIKEIGEQASVVPQTFQEPAENGFRPLTDQEKEQFLASLDEAGKQILTELAIRNPLQKSAHRDVKSTVASSEAVDG